MDLIEGFEIECIGCARSYELKKCGNRCSQPTCKQQGMMCYSWPAPAEENMTQKEDGEVSPHPQCKAVCRCAGQYTDVSHQGQCNIQEFCRKGNHD